jgi:plastocyanin
MRRLPLAAALVAALPGTAVAHPGHGPEEVRVGAGAFAPASVTVGTGDTVIWSWGSEPGHSVTADPGQAERFDSDPGTAAPSHPPADLFAHVFRSTGEFGYHCKVHPLTMRGTVTVVETPGSDDLARPVLSRLLVRGRLLTFLVSERATVLARIELRVRGRWRVRRDFDVYARRGLNRRRLPLGGLGPGRYRLRLTAYDDADNRSRTKRVRLRIARR